jgi:mono/diheme cytochrome c family protein
MRIQSLSLKGFVHLLILASAVSTGFAATTSKRPPDSEIRAGYEIAVTTCVACHVVSPDQSIRPIEGRTSSSFQEIANRPTVTLDSLAQRTMGCSAAMTLYPHCMPFDHISDREWREVAYYILSLRSSP